MIGACPINENLLMFSTYGTIDNQNSNNNNISNNTNNNNNNNKKNSNKHARDSISYGVGSHHLDDNGDDDDDGTNTIRMTTVLRDFDPAQNLSSFNETLQKKVTVTSSSSSSSIVPPSIESPSLVLPSMKYDDHEHIVSCSSDDRFFYGYSCIFVSLSSSSSSPNVSYQLSHHITHLHSTASISCCYVVFSSSSSSCILSGWKLYCTYGSWVLVTVNDTPTLL